VNNDEAFARWWYDCGSGIVPKRKEEVSEFAERVAREAWTAARESINDPETGIPPLNAGGFFYEF